MPISPLNVKFFQTDPFYSFYHRKKLMSKCKKRGKRGN